jgi:hypothetical protein
MQGVLSLVAARLRPALKISFDKNFRFFVI